MSFWHSLFTQAFHPFLCSFCLQFSLYFVASLELLCISVFENDKILLCFIPYKKQKYLFYLLIWLPLYCNFTLKYEITTSFVKTVNISLSRFTAFVFFSTPTGRSRWPPPGVWIRSWFLPHNRLLPGHRLTWLAPVASDCTWNFEMPFNGI